MKPLTKKDRMVTHESIINAMKYHEKGSLVWIKDVLLAKEWLKEQISNHHVVDLQMGCSVEVMENLIDEAFDIEEKKKQNEKKTSIL